MSRETAPPFLDEQTLVNDRLIILEQELAAGTYDHEPIQFFAATELEVGFLYSPQFRPLLHDSAHDETLKRANILIPDRAVTVLSHEEQLTKIRSVKEEALQMIGALQPQNIDEQLLQQEWQGQVENFNYSDALNFLLYKEFSKPTLGNTTVPQDASPDQLQAYGAEQDWLEFRFGTGMLQTGYYDNPGTSELRFTPCTPTELVRREQIITERMVQLATEFGVVVAIGGRHINLSAYREDAGGQWQSVLGTAESSTASTLAAAAGITQAIEEGAWLHEASTAEQANFQNVLPDRFHITSRGRDTIRVKRNYLELREQNLIGDTAHGLLLLMAGTAEGLEKGWGTLAQEVRGVPVPRRELLLRLTEDFVKEQHLPILRALENSHQNEHGGLTVESHFWDDEDTVLKLTHALLGDEFTKNMDIMQAYAFNEAIFGALRIGEDGSLYCTPESLRASMQHMKMNSLVPFVEPFVTQSGEALAGVVNDKARTIKISGRQTLIRGNPHYEGRTPEQTRERLKNSNVFNRMYGERSGMYAAALAVRAASSSNR